MRCLRLLVLLVCLQSTLFADDLNVSGYVKTFVSLWDTRYSDVLCGQAACRLRVKLYWPVWSDLTVACAYEITPRAQDGCAGLGFQQAPAYRAADLNPYLYPGRERDAGSFVLMQSLDRLYVAWSRPWADITIGRQAIGFGIAKTVSPMDILAPFRFQDLDKEERAGIDALRVEIPLGMMAELDVGAVLGDDAAASRGACFARSRLYVARTDLVLMIAGYQKHILLAANLARSVGPLGTWMEAAHTWTHGSGEYFRITAGLDYRWPNAIYTYLEYHFNGSGGAQGKNSSYMVQNSAYRAAGGYLQGRHYLCLGLNYSLTPLLVYDQQALWNMRDGSLLLAPRLEYSISEDVYLDVGAYIGTGPGTCAHRTDSEFSEKLYYFALRVFY